MIETMAKEPSPSQLNTANYGNFLKVRREREREREKERERDNVSVQCPRTSQGLAPPTPPPRHRLRSCCWGQTLLPTNVSSMAGREALTVREESNERAKEKGDGSTQGGVPSSSLLVLFPSWVPQLAHSPPRSIARGLRSQ